MKERERCPTCGKVKKKEKLKTSQAIVYYVDAKEDIDVGDIFLSEPNFMPEVLTSAKEESNLRNGTYFIWVVVKVHPNRCGTIELMRGCHHIIKDRINPSILSG